MFFLKGLMKKIILTFFLIDKETIFLLKFKCFVALEFVQRWLPEKVFGFRLESTLRQLAPIFTRSNLICPKIKNCM
ncbi:MAG: hypothetical protein EBU93_04410 [Chlamydiae bacterium]|nr:hypothetical protein [Chlamydiota bacterium]